MSWCVLNRQTGGTPAVGGCHRSRDDRKIDDDLAAQIQRRQ